MRSPTANVALVPWKKGPSMWSQRSNVTGTCSVPADSAIASAIDFGAYVPCWSTRTSSRVRAACCKRSNILRFMQAATPSSEGRPMRADARKNHRRLLDAAIGLILELGGEPSRDAVADRAGVGIATLYRHFPDRH